MHAHSRTIGASLRRSMPKTVHLHVRGARFTPLAYNGCTAQATRNRYTILTAHAEHCASTRTHTSARKVHHLVRTCLTSYTHIHRTHDDGSRLGLHKTTAVHAHINAHTYKGTLLGLHMSDAVPYAHPRKMRITSSGIKFHRTLHPGK